MCEFWPRGNRSVGIAAQTQWRPKQIFVSATAETVILTACASRESSSIYQCLFVAHGSNQIASRRPKKLWRVSESICGQYFLSLHSSTFSPLSPARKHDIVPFTGLLWLTALCSLDSHTNQHHILIHNVHHGVLPLSQPQRAFSSVSLGRPASVYLNLSTSQSSSSRLSILFITHHTFLSTFFQSLLHCYKSSSPSLPSSGASWVGKQRCLLGCKTSRHCLAVCKNILWCVCRQLHYSPFALNVLLFLLFPHSGRDLQFALNIWFIWGSSTWDLLFLPVV